MEESKKKVYLETSFVSYLTGRATTREPIASWQAASRQWWEAVRPSCDLFVSRYVVMEAEKGDAEQVARRIHGTAATWPTSSLYRKPMAF